MNLAGLSLPDLAGLVLGFTFTLMVFSYLLGDNPLFRLALHVFIGVATGFALVVVTYNILWFQLLLPLLQRPMENLYLLLPPLLFGLWLLIKLSPRLAFIGNPVMAYLTGAGAAAVIGGAVLGTLFPQIGASSSLFDLSETGLFSSQGLVLLIRSIIILAGTILTILYFYFGVRQSQDGTASRPRWIQELSGIGGIFIAMTFGVLFAGVYSAALTAFIERMRFLLDTVIGLIPLG